MHRLRWNESFEKLFPSRSAWLTGGFTFLLRSVRSKHRTVDHKNETITVDFWFPQLLVCHRGYDVLTNCCNYRMVISRWYSTKTLTDLQNKTKHPTTENKRITEIVESHEVIFELKWSKIYQIQFNNRLADFSQFQEPLCASWTPPLVPAIRICWKRK